MAKILLWNIGPIALILLLYTLAPIVGAPIVFGICAVPTVPVALDLFFNRFTWSRSSFWWRPEEISERQFLGGRIADRTVDTNTPSRQQRFAAFIIGLFRRWPSMTRLLCHWGNTPNGTIEFRALPWPIYSAFFGALLAIEGGQVVGGIICGVPFVPPENRRNGIGRELVLASFRWRLIRFLAPIGYSSAGRASRQRAYRLAMDRAFHASNSAHSSSQ